MLARSKDRVQKPQWWPHAALRGEFVTRDVAFSDLDFRLFVAGELEIVTTCKASVEQRIGRLQLLKQLAYLLGGYSWETLRGVYASIVSQIEQNNLKWSQWDTEFLPQIQWALVRAPSNAKKASQSKNTTATKSAEEGTWFCREYNKGTCDKGDSHSGSHKGRKVTVSHICAKCWLTDHVKNKHSERDSSCPKNQRDM